MDKRYILPIIVVVAAIVIFFATRGGEEVEVDNNTTPEETLTDSKPVTTITEDGEIEEPSEGGGELIAQEIPTVAPKEVRKYSNSGLGISVSVPSNWVPNESSKPGKYTVRLSGGNLSTGMEFFDIWAHGKEFVLADLGTGIKIDGESAYGGHNPDCSRLDFVSCVGEVLYIPMEEGTYEDGPNGRVWKVKVLELTYGIAKSSVIANEEQTLAGAAKTFNDIRESLRFSF